METPIATLTYGKDLAQFLVSSGEERSEIGFGCGVENHSLSTYLSAIYARLKSLTVCTFSPGLSFKKSIPQDILHFWVRTPSSGLLLNMLLHN